MYNKYRKIESSLGQLYIKLIIKTRMRDSRGRDLIFILRERKEGKTKNEINENYS